MIVAINLVMQMVGHIIWACPCSIANNAGTSHIAFYDYGRIRCRRPQARQAVLNAGQSGNDGGLGGVLFDSKRWVGGFEGLLLDEAAAVASRS